MEPERRCAHCQQASQDEYCDHICRAGALCQISRSLWHCDVKFARYKWIREIAKNVGQHGVIYLVFDTLRREKTVIKVQPYLETFPSATAKCDNEMIVACRVSGRAGFLRLYDYWICNVKPVDQVFRSAIKKRHLEGQTKLFYMEMERADGTLTDLREKKTPFSYLEKALFLFELLYALNKAWRDMRFIHGDLNPGNIFYVLTGEPRTYMTPDGGELQLHTTYYRPLIGDFGSSSLGDANSEKHAFDLESVFAEFEAWRFRKFRLTNERKARAVKDGHWDSLLGDLFEHIKQIYAEDM